MSAEFDYLWDGSAPLGSARVVWHTSSRLVVRATDTTTKAGVLRFRNTALGRSTIALHELWKAIQDGGFVMAQLEHRVAWEIAQAAERNALAVEQTIKNLGGSTFFDPDGRAIEVPVELHDALLDRMRAAGCEIDVVAVD